MGSNFKQVTPHPLFSTYMVCLCGTASGPCVGISFGISGIGSRIGLISGLAGVLGFSGMPGFISGLPGTCVISGFWPGVSMIVYFISLE